MGTCQHKKTEASIMCIVCAREGTVGIVERLGQFSGLIKPGLNLMCWPLSNVAAVLSMRMQQLNVPVETKTKDNVFITVVVAVQYRVIESQAKDAYYKLTSPHGQIT